MSRTEIERLEKREKLLDELALVVDGDREAIERHADFLADDDEARDLKHDAIETAERLAKAGADFVVPGDLEAKLMAALDARGTGAVASGESAKEEEPGRTTSPGFVLDPQAQAQIARNLADQARAAEEESAAKKEIEVAPTISMKAVAEEQPGTGTGTGTAEKKSAGGSQMGKVLFLFGALGLAAAAAVALAIAGTMVIGTDGPVADNDDGETVTPAPTATTATIAQIVRASSDETASGVEIREAGGAWRAASASATVPAGAAIRTDARTRARLALSDGSELVLNHSTEVRFDAREARHFEIPSGEVLADIAHLEQGPNAAFAVPTGRVEVLGTKFVLAATDDAASVRVTRGSVRVHGAAGGSGEVKQGEEGVIRPQGNPEIAPVMDLARSLAWADLDNGPAAASDEDTATTLPGIGSLRARRPGETSDRERPLHLARHDVRVRISGAVARTEIEEVFRNDSDQELEGIYRFPLPSDAQIARLALDVEGNMMEGSFVAADRARRIWAGVIRNATPVAQRRATEEFIWVPGPWRDPALLEWQRGGQFELRIFPIPAHGERRVVLAYTQTIAPQADGRRYVYPLAHSRDASTEVGQMSFDVRVAGAERVQPSGYEMQTATEEGASRLRYAQSGFRPNGDLVVDYALPGREQELSYWTYQGPSARTAPPEHSRDRDREVIDLQRQIAADDRGYVAFALRPELPARTEGRARDYVIVVDSSQSMVGERFQRAAALASGVVAEMDRRDRFTVLACDYACRSPEGTASQARMRVPTAAESRSVAEWLGRVEPAGASDLVATLRAASGAGGEHGDRAVHVIYVGDGVASVGHRSAGAIAADAERVAQRAHVAFTTVGLGSDADSVALAAIARAGGGHYVPFVPGERVSLAALSVLETTYGVALRDARIELPEGLVDVAPAALPTIRAGEEVIVTARMARNDVRGTVVLRGTVGGEAYEQRYDVALAPSTSAGNLFVPALWASRTIQDLELEDRGSDEARIVALSRSHAVMSRHTSLLVLESDQMFRAFGIDRPETAAAQWTGETASEGGGAAGQVAFASDLGTGEGDGVALDDMLAGATAGGDAAGVMGGGTLGGLAHGRGGGAGGGGSSGAGYGGTRSTSAAGPMRVAADPAVAEAPGEAEEASREARGRRAEQAPAGTTAQAQTRADFDQRWDAERQQRPMPDVATATPAPTMPSARPRGPGQWMRRVYYRVGEIQGDGSPTFREQEAARLAEESLRQQPDSRDRHRTTVRALARAGSLERALEVAEAWFARDRQDPEALVARADVLARMGRRDEALRILTGIVDLRSGDAALHERLAAAFDRAGDTARSCAHRISIAEIRSDAASMGNAIRCERAAGDRELADLLLGSVREASVRERAIRAAETTPSTSTPRGELSIEASWTGGDDVDIALIAPDGSRLSWMGGRTTVFGRDSSVPGHEQLGLRSASVGQYLVEVSRTNPDDHDPIRGQLRLRAFDDTRTIPFVLDDEERASVARVVVRRESRMEAVGGGW